ncbi:adenylate cyclase [Ruminococcus sp. YE71]|uniref:adenylate/guanylate cyclase domain-containing protein n=1 Tax=unclassified Ruminococcus TaxID=2608920 RepID=UPI00087E403D|nr:MULTISPECIES: adenylate/guanylate cyclase domain-containing protein [unclassified Ruminococcus]SDA30448.1 adenylate cyclase [Ruminococcus sp. YE78]SFW49636.1 adenylate cyclase [Ruminococcus sp. YE71]
MKEKLSGKQRELLVKTAETVFIILVSFIFCYFDILGSFEKLVTDRLYQRPRGINNKIKIIAIDNQTLREYGNMGTWSRQMYADVINSLSDYPDVIVMDLLLTGSMDEAGDKALRDACAASGRVISGSYINYSRVYKYREDGTGYIDNFNIETIDQPIMSGSCATGFVNALPDSDGVLRSALLTSSHDGEELYSLSYKAYKMYCEKNGITEAAPELRNGRMNIQYAGRPGNYEIVPLCNILSGDIDPRVFSGCIVVIGAYATGLYDQYAVPNSSELMFGCEIHANIIQALIDKKYPVVADRMTASLMFAFTAGLIFLLFRRMRPGLSITLMAVIVAGFAAAVMAINNAGLRLPFIYFPLSAVAVCALSIIHSYISASAERKKISDTFKKYVAPQVVEEITKSGGYSISLGGESREIAVLFVDIRGFTPMSENLSPEQVVDILNSYLELTTNSIFNNGGTLDKFIGDATMAVFNAPFDLDDYVFKAVKTALDIVAGGDAIESKFLEKYGRSVGFGVGVNCGRAVVGNIGCSFRMDYTAIGDTVNTAARLEANAKRGQVLISESVYEKVKDRVTAEPIGAIPLKGKSKEVFVYSLTGLAEEKTAAEETSD